MASLTPWTQVWANSGRRWRTDVFTLCIFRFPCALISLLLNEYPLMLLVQQVSWWFLSAFECLKIMYFAFVLKSYSSKYWILDWQLSVNTLKMPFHGLCVCMVPSEKCHPVFLLLIITFLFSLAVFWELSLQHWLWIMIHAWISFSCAWSSLGFWDLWVYSFHPVWEVWGHYFFKHFFCLSHHLSFGDSNHPYIRKLEISP